MRDNAANPHDLTLVWLDRLVAVARLPADSPCPACPHPPPEFWSVTRTSEEISIVTDVDCMPAGAVVEQPWRALRVAGTLDFSMVGVLSMLTAALAEASISAFALSTYDTDYLLVPSRDAAAAARALRRVAAIADPTDVTR